MNIFWLLYKETTALNSASTKIKSSGSTRWDFTPPARLHPPPLKCLHNYNSQSALLLMTMKAKDNDNHRWQEKFDRDYYRDVLRTGRNHHEQRGWSPLKLRKCSPTYSSVSSGIWWIKDLCGLCTQGTNWVWNASIKKGRRKGLIKVLRHQKLI